MNRCAQRLASAAPSFRAADGSGPARSAVRRIAHGTTGTLLAGLLLQPPAAGAATPLPQNGTSPGRPAAATISESDAIAPSDSLQCRPIQIASLVSRPLPPFQFCAPGLPAPGAPSRAPTAATATYSPERALALQDQAILQDQLVRSQQQMVESGVFGLKSAKGSWWPTASMSNSSLLFTDIQASQNYGGSPTTPASPATAGKAFNPFNGSSTRDLRRRSRPGLTPLQRSSSDYTQAYPVITLQWNFLDPARRPQISLARRQLELAQSQVDETILSRTDSLSRNLAQYLLSGLKIGELNQLVVLQNQSLQESTKRVEAGLDPRLSRVQQFRTLLDFQSQMLQAKLSQSNAALQLQETLRLGKPAASPATSGDAPASSDASNDVLSLDQLITYLPVNQFPISEWPYNLEDTLSRAIKASPDLQQLKLQAGIAVDNANAEWAGVLPTIGVLGYSTYQYTWGSQNYQPPAQPKGAFSTALSSYIGLSVTWNLFDGHINRNQALSYDRQAKSLLTQYEDTKRQLVVNVKSLHSQLALLRQQIALNLSDYEAALAISADMDVRARYKLNSSSDSLQSRMDTHQSRLQLLAAISEYLDVFAKLAIQAGLSPLAVR